MLFCLIYSYCNELSECFAWVALGICILKKNSFWFWCITLLEYYNRGSKGFLKHMQADPLIIRHVGCAQNISGCVIVYGVCLHSSLTPFLLGCWFLGRSLTFCLSVSAHEAKFGSAFEWEWAHKYYYKYVLGGSWRLLDDCNHPNWIFMSQRSNRRVTTAGCWDK